MYGEPRFTVYSRGRACRSDVRLPPVEPARFLGEKAVVLFGTGGLSVLKQMVRLLLMPAAEVDPFGYGQPPAT